MSFAALPNELLGECFSWVATNEADSSGTRLEKPHIKNLRLVCRRFSEVGSSYLITRLNVALNNRSLRQLERISNHLHFSKSVAKISINASYRERQYALQLSQFAFVAQRKIIGWIGEPRAPSGWSTEAAERTEFDRLDKVHRDIDAEWYKAKQHVFKRENATERQEQLLQAYDTYLQVYKDQESALRDGRLMRGLMAACEKFPKLTTIKFSDGRYKAASIGQGAQVWTEKDVGQPCPKGVAYATPSLNAPAFILLDLFCALSNSNFRPRRFRVDICGAWEFFTQPFTDTQLESIRETISQAEHIDLRLKDFYRPFNATSNDQQGNLRAFTSAYLGSPRLKHLTLYFDPELEYLMDTLSIGTAIALPMHSPKLESITCQAAMSFTELQLFVSSIKDTLRSLDLKDVSLSSGTWTQALEELRQFEKLEAVQLTFAEAIFDWSVVGEVTVLTRAMRERIHDYILRRTGICPIDDDWVPPDRNG